MKKNIVFMVFLGVLLINTTAWAGELTIPNAFTAGTTAVASEVNANFSAVEAAVDDNNTRINTNTVDISTNTGNIATNATDISTNASNIADNAANISTNVSDIAALQTPTVNRAGAKSEPIVFQKFTFDDGLTNICSITVDVPGPGMLIFYASGLMCFYDHTNGTLDKVYCGIALAQDAEPPSRDAELIVPAEIPTVIGLQSFGVPLGITKAFTVSAAGSVEGCLNCKVLNGSDAFVDFGTMTVLYVPVELQ